MFAFPIMNVQLCKLWTLSFDKTQGSDFVIKLTLNAKGVQSNASCYRLIILAPSKVNANIKLYMRISSWNVMALFSLLVKKTSSSCGVVGRLGNRTLPFSQHRENCGLLLLNFANRSLIHIFALQNPQIMSISPQSHRAEVDASSFPNNCNGSADFKHAWHAIPSAGDCDVTCRFWRVLIEFC